MDFSTPVKKLKTEPNFAISQSCLLCDSTDQRCLDMMNNSNSSSFDRRELLTRTLGKEVSDLVNDCDRLCVKCSCYLVAVNDYINDSSKKIIQQKMQKNDNAFHNGGNDEDFTGYTNKNPTSDLYNRITDLNNSQCPTPNNLLTPVRTVPVNPESRAYISTQKYQKSCHGDWRNTPGIDRELDQEVQFHISGTGMNNRLSEVFGDDNRSKSRKRKRGHNWSMQKRRRSRSRSRCNTDPGRWLRARTESRESRRSSRAYERKETEVDFEKRPETRAKSRIVEEKEREIAAQHCLGVRPFVCEEANCTEQFIADEELEKNALDRLTEHLKDVHKKLLLFHCLECRKDYSKLEHLEQHKAGHYTVIRICPYCRMEFYSMEEMQEHINDHMIYYVPCNYCDLQFLEAGELNKHIKEVHKEGKRRVRPVRARILYRMDKNSDVDITTTLRSNFDRPHSRSRRKRSRSRSVRRKRPVSAMESRTADEGLDREPAVPVKKQFRSMYFDNPVKKKYGEYGANQKGNKIREEIELIEPYRKMRLLPSCGLEERESVRAVTPVTPPPVLENELLRDVRADGVDSQED